MTDIKDNFRVRFPKNQQREFLKDAQSKLNIKSSNLASISNVYDRTLRDWKREKYTMSFHALKTICEKIRQKIPRDIEILPEHWSLEKGRMIGGRRYAELYGSPGTPEGRRKGGIKSQSIFRNNPYYIRTMGVISRKKIKYPYKSSLLAEFIGVMLGDGNVRSKYQIAISYNGKEDKKYAAYIQVLLKKLFNISSTNRFRKEETRADVVATGRNLVEFLEKMGVKRGNKVKNQIDVPKWIFENKKYQASCLRGLFDTDGCVYEHSYTVNNKKYKYVKMCFRNYSIPLLVSIKKILKNLNFNAKLNVRQKSVHLHSPCEVNKYFLRVGTSNIRYYNKFKSFLK